ncbi:MAG TPA: hypothetical protein VNG91_08650, partial [Terriglobia bacterium]|nr:hypothetical protein [Terriglobia bacterium]
MKAFRQISMAVLLTALAGAAPLSAQQPAQPSSLVQQTLEKIIAQEKQLIKTFSTYSPRVETYIQEIHTVKDRKSKI